MSKLLDEIKGNDVVDFKLDDFPEEFDALDLVAAFQVNNSIETVTFEEECLMCCKSDDRSRLIEATGELPKLKEFSAAGCLVTMEALSLLVIHAQGLRRFSLRDVVLQGIEGEYSTFEAAIRSHPNLKEFELEECDAAVEEVKIDSLLDFADSKPLATGKSSSEMSKSSAIAA